MRYLTFTLSVLLVPTIGSAHHSRAEFADDVVEIEGEIVEIAWRNPHPVLTISVTNDAGEQELWEVESWSSANGLARKGVVGDVFELGQEVRAAVRLSGRRPGTFLGESIDLGNGTQAVLRPGLDPVFPGLVLDGILESTITELKGRDRSKPVTFNNMYNQIHPPEQALGTGSSRYDDGRIRFDNQNTHGLYSHFDWAVTPQ